MRNKELFKRAIIITTLSLSISTLVIGCGKQEQEVISESVEEVAPTEEETKETTDNKEEPIEDDSVSENDISTSKGTEEKGEEFTLTDMDTQMLVTQQAFTYEQPSSEALKIGAVQKDEVVHVIGQVNNTNWFKISQEGEVYSFLESTYLTAYTPEEVSQPQEAVQQQQPVQQEQPVVDQPQQEVVQQQPVVDQPQQEVVQPETETPASTGPIVDVENGYMIDENGTYFVLNPETGQPYQVGDIMHTGGIWAGDVSNNPYW